MIILASFFKSFDHKHETRSPYFLSFDRFLKLISSLTILYIDMKILVTLIPPPSFHILFPQASTLLSGHQVPIPLLDFFCYALLLHCNPLSSPRAASIGIGVELSVRESENKELRSDYITEDNDVLSPSSLLLPLAILGRTGPATLSWSCD